jgi:hypothetical protein
MRRLNEQVAYRLGMASGVLLVLAALIVIVLVR